MTEHLELVKRAKSGDEEAFIRLIESQSDCMYKMAKTILKNEEDVADAMAETVLVCWEKLSTLKENRYVKTWMIRILMNKCYDLLRKKELLLTEDTVSEADAREDGYGMAECSLLDHFSINGSLGSAAEKEPKCFVFYLFYTSTCVIRYILQRHPLL